MLIDLLQLGSNDLMRQAQIFLYENGKDQPPTAIDLNKELVKDFLFNQSPARVYIHLYITCTLNCKETSNFFMKKSF